MGDAKKDEPVSDKVPEKGPDASAAPAADAPRDGALRQDGFGVQGNRFTTGNATADRVVGFDMRLVGLCVLLWAVAIGIFFSSWDETKKDYYWGNIRQALDQPMGGYVDTESVKALAAMGEAVLPSCEHELRSQPDPLYKCAVLRVVEEVSGEKSRLLLATEAQQDPDARVRANALLILRSRAAKVPAEKAPLAEVAKERVANEREIAARAIAGVILGQAGEKTAEIEGLLVYALRIPPLRKDAWDCLKAAKPSIPAVDATKEEEALKQVMTVETWCKDNGIALVDSPLTMRRMGDAPGGAPQTAASPAPAATPAPATSPAPAASPSPKTGK